jgi:hypothetical protein
MVFVSFGILMLFYANKIVLAQFKAPLAHLEGPEESGFAQNYLNSKKPIPTGASDPYLHKFQEGNVIAKEDPASVALEPLAYHLGKRLGVSVPRTSVRNLPNPVGVLKPHSVQEHVVGIPDKLVANQDFIDVRRHPSTQSMYLFDWLTGNSDRHDENAIYNDKTKTMHAIDNGALFDYGYGGYGKTNEQGHLVDANVLGLINANLTSKLDQSTPISEDFRKKILAADPNEHKSLIATVLNHPIWDQTIKHRKQEGAWASWYPGMKKEQINQAIINQYLRRLHTLKSHFSDPNVKTMFDLNSRLFTPPDD